MNTARLFFRLALPLWMLVVVTSLHGNDYFSRTDAFEYTNIKQLSVSSIWVNPSDGHTFDPNQIFGSESSTQEGPNGEFAFADGVFPIVDWVEWEMPQGVPLTAYRLGLSNDFPVVPWRQVEEFTLMAADKNGVFQIIDRFVPDYNPIANNNLSGLPGANLDVTRTLTNRVVARRFRAEFQRTFSLKQGCRVMEIDAIVTPNAEPPSVFITDPAPDIDFFSNQAIPVHVEATDSDGIDEVSLYVDGILLGTRKTGYDFVWEKPSAGFHTLEARAADKLGAEGSHAISIEVLEGTEIRLGKPRVGAGYVHFDVLGGNEGRRQVVFKSIDLKTWTRIDETIYPGEAWTFSEPLTGNPGFYRVVEVSPDSF